MTDLYNRSDILAIRRRIIRWRVAVAVMLTALIASSVVLALTVTTATEGRNELIVIISSAVGGWIVFYAINFIILASRRELAHAMMLAGEPHVAHTGRVVASGARFRIRKSVTVRKFTFETDSGETLSLSVSDNAAGRFFSDAADGALLDIEVAHGYVAAWSPASGKERDDR